MQLVNLLREKANMDRVATRKAHGFQSSETPTDESYSSEHDVSLANPYGNIKDMILERHSASEEGESSLALDRKKKYQYQYNLNNLANQLTTEQEESGTTSNSNFEDDYVVDTETSNSQSNQKPMSQSATESLVGDSQDDSNFDESLE